jgi:hypothetical protein
MTVAMTASSSRCLGDGDMAPRQPMRCCITPIATANTPTSGSNGRWPIDLLDEPIRQRLGQCSNGELLLLARDRAHRAQTYRTTEEAKADVSD